MSASETTAMDAVGMTIEKYLKSTEEKRNGSPLDNEDTPVIGIFNNGMVIINIVDDEMKIDVKGGSPMEFKDINIDIFGSNEEVSHE